MPRNPDNSRLEPYSPRDLREVGKRLKKAAAAMNALAVAMEHSETKQIEVEGHKMLERGFESISKFVGNCQKKISEF